MPAARAAFYRVFVDVGAGREYWGLYTMIEDPADGAMLDAQFGGRDGNLYKPDGPGADWTRFDRRGILRGATNGDAANHADVVAAIEALHAPRDNPAAWRAALEARFDVDLFLRWLAVNTVMENWDSYGVMAHNYYLYGDPAQGGRLRWIPWDHNMAFGAGPGFGRGFPGPPGGVPGRGVAGPGPFGGFGRGGPPPAGLGRGARGPAGLPFGPGRGDDVLHEQVGDAWPLIQRLMADEVYAARYRELLVHALGGLFAPERVREARARSARPHRAVGGGRARRTARRTRPSARREAFEGSLDGAEGLLARVRRRQAAVRAALDRVAGR